MSSCRPQVSPSRRPRQPVLRQLWLRLRPRHQCQRQRDLQRCRDRRLHVDDRQQRVSCFCLVVQTQRGAVNKIKQKKLFPEAHRSQRFHFPGSRGASLGQISVSTFPGKRLGV